MKKPKFSILFIVPDFPVISETFVVNQLIYLLDQGHKVNILAYNRSDHPVNEIVTKYQLLEKTTFLNIPRSPARKLKAFSKLALQHMGRGFFKSLNLFQFKLDVFKLSPLFKFASLKTLNENQYDIIHAHFAFTSELYFTGRYFGFFRNSKLLVTFHGYDMHPADVSKNRKRYKHLFKYNTPITVNNQYGKFLLAKINSNHTNITTLAVGLDTNYCKPRAHKQASPSTRILFCGRLIALKGCLFVIELANLLVNKKGRYDLYFDLIGDGEEYDNIQTLTTQYNLKNHIRLLGMQTQDEVVRSMNDADIFLLPGITEPSGRAESQGLVIQEAQAMGLPVIISDAGGMKYGVMDNITGYVIKEGDLKGFCDAIELLADDPHLRSKIGRSGREYVTQNFDSRVLGRKQEQLYSHLMAQQ